MKKLNFSISLLALFSLALLGQGCFGTSTAPSGPDGGVWKTTDRTETWVNKRALVAGTKVTTDAGNFAVKAMAFDPQDENAIYLATLEHGLVYTLDGGNSWQAAGALNKGKINDVAVDPKHKCTVYAVSGNKIYKTETCMRDWNQIFYDARTDKSFTQIAVDWFNSTILFSGTSEGDIFKSTDSGKTWTAVTRVEGVDISSLVIDPRDSRVIYAGTSGDGIWKSLDSGNTWLQIKKQFGDDLRDARKVTQLVIDPKNSNVLYLVSKLGILKSEDQGETWNALNLISPPGTVEITALAIDPTDSNKMVYTGPVTLVLTSDGGKSWSAKKLPTTRGGSALLISPKNGNTIYLGTQLRKK
ncbi:hypothetical protein KKF59_02840 [Patescibacteria group bacterium]|nr:hypothetical protein [Patescibacteria group bacterium]MBU1908045.1 hypothetical protein [Patescibacteria group bacterium]